MQIRIEFNFYDDDDKVSSEVVEKSVLFCEVKFVKQVYLIPTMTRSQLLSRHPRMRNF